MINPSDLLTALRRTVEQLAAFNELAKALTSTLEVREVLKLVMQKVSEMVRPSNWSLLLLDEHSGQLYFEVVVGPGSERLKDLRVSPGEGIAGHVFSSGKPLRMDDATHSPAFSARFDALTDFQTGPALAVPLVSKGRVLGVIELVHPKGSPSFSDEDLISVGAIADFAAIAIENARNFSRVQELTITDEHTRLYNARHLRAVLEKEVERARRFRHPLSLLFLDLDRFKEVNDTWGHLAGSALLAEVGELLRDCVREVDFPFRYGGDEFAVVLLETNQAGARAVAERIRAAFASHTFLQAKGQALKLTASIGAATFPEDGDSALDLLHSADSAMYQVKAAGRDGIKAASG